MAQTSARFQIGVTAVFLLCLLVPRLAAGAGNVNAFVDRNGNLAITGDTGANELFLSQIGPGQYRIDVLAGTLLNRQPIAGDDFVGVVGDVIIRLDGGDDKLTIVDAVFPQRLFVWGDAGNDEIELQDVRVNGAETLIHGGKGSDDVKVLTSVFAGNLSIGTVAGDDFVKVEDVFGVGGRFEVDTGQGVDFVEVAFSSGFAGATRIATGEGGLDTIFVHDSTFTFTPPPPSTSSVQLLGGKGDLDSFFLESNTFAIPARSLVLDGGEGQNDFWSDLGGNVGTGWPPVLVNIP